MHFHSHLWLLCFSFISGWKILSEHMCFMDVSWCLFMAYHMDFMVISCRMITGGYGAWYRLQVIQVSNAFITRRLLMAFLDHLDIHFSLIQVSISIFHYYYWDPFLYAYFYLQGYKSCLFLELDFSNHCGNFVLGFLAKNCIDWTTHFAYSKQLVHRWFFMVRLWGMWTPLGMSMWNLEMYSWHIQHGM